MTSVAYLVFTFVACIVGAGLGLIIHRAIAKRRAEEAELPPEVLEKGEEAGLEVIHQWQVHENRVFASMVSACAGFPVAIAAMGWTSRSEVVGKICSGLSQVAIHSPLCF